MTEQPPEETLSAEVINLSGGAIDTVEAELVRITQGGANRVVATEVDLRMSAALALEAATVGMHRSAAVLVRGEAVSAEDCGSAAIVADDLHFTGSRAGLVVAGRAQLDHSSTVVLLARQVDGPVEAVLDTRGALLAGLVAGVTVGMVLFAGSLLARQRR